MAASPEIAVKGLKEARKAFKDFGADAGWREPFKDAYRTGADIAEREARSLAGQARPTLGGSMASMGGAAIATIRGKGTTTAATLTAGKGVAYFGGWNFGSKGAFRQFPAKAVPDYNLYAGIAAKREEIQNVFIESIGRAFDQAFPD